MLYETTRKFLEIFGLRDLRELPSVAEINELIPEGMVEQEEDKQTLSSLTEGMSMTYEHDVGRQDEYEKISTQLTDIKTTTDFFEQEKERQRKQKEKDRADDIRELIASGAEVEAKDKKWLEKYEAQLLAPAAVVATESVEAETTTEQVAEQSSDESGEKSSTTTESSSEESSTEAPTTLQSFQEKKLEEALADFDEEP